jgi:hypothetical protein
MELTPELQAFLQSKLDSFEKLELVLALRAANKPLTVAELAVELQVGRDELRRVAKDVVDSGIADLLDGDLVGLRSGSWGLLLDEAAGIYVKEPARLMRAITRISMAKIRGMGARTFADAFRFRKKGD